MHRALQLATTIVSSVKRANGEFRAQEWHCVKAAHRQSVWSPLFTLAQNKQQILAKIFTHRYL